MTPGTSMNPLLANADHARIVDAEHCRWRRTRFRGTGNFQARGTTRRLFVLPAADDHGAAGQTNVFINSWSRGGSSARRALRRRAIGAPPGALANAIYNACGVRIREHPVTKDAIMAGLKANGKGEVIA